MSPSPFLGRRLASSALPRGVGHPTYRPIQRGLVGARRGVPAHGVPQAPIPVAARVKVNGVEVHPSMVPFLQALRTEARRIGASFRLTSGFRSAVEQAHLRAAWAAGRDVPGRPGWRSTSRGMLYKPAAFSYHTSGLAVDAESNRLTELGVFARGLGMRWDPRDPVHFDLGRST